MNYPTGNLSPVTVADSYSVIEDTTLDVAATQGVLSNDSDPNDTSAPDGKVLLFAELDPAQPAVPGTLTFCCDGSFTFTPTPGFYGQVTFTYRATDLNLWSNTQTVTIDVIHINRPPTITDTADQSTPVNQILGPLFVSIGDLETPVASLGLFVTSSNPALIPLGNISVSPTGSQRLLFITPTPNITGTSLITLTVTDADGASTSDSFIVKVQDRGDIFGTAWQDYDGDGLRDTSPFEPGLSGVQVFLDLNDNQVWDSDEPLSLTTSDNPTTLADETGAYHFGELLAGSYMIREVVPVGFVETFPQLNNPVSGRGHLVNLQLGQVRSGLNFGNQPINTPPTNHLPGIPFAAQEETPATLSGLSVSDFDPLAGIYTTVLSVTHGTLSVNAGGNAVTLLGNGSVTVTISATLAAINATLSQVNGVVYVPDTNFTGLAELTIVTNDNGNTGTGGPLADTDTLTIQVASLNDAPTAFPQSISTAEDTAVGMTLAGDDGDTNLSQVLTFTIVQPPQFGTIISFDPATGELTYLPGTNFNGADGFMFTVTDDTSAGGTAIMSSPASVVIQVSPMNDAPTISGLAPVTITEDSPSGSLPFTVGDVDSPFSGLLVSAMSSNPALIPVGHLALNGISQNRTLQLTPLPDAFGTAVITLVVNDGSGGTTSTSFVVNVLPVNDIPAFTGGGNVGMPADPVAVTVPGWATDITSGPANENGQTVSFLVTSTNPALFTVTPTINPTTGNLTFTPRGDQFGTATVSVRIRDNGGTLHGGVDTSAVQTFTVTLTTPATRRFEFNASPTLQTAGYTSVRGTDLYDAVTGPVKKFGWNAPVTEADRAALSANTLLRDGHYGRDNTFTAELPDGSYRVSLIVGDKSYARDRLTVYANGVLVPELTNINTAAGQFLQRSFTATVTNGRLDVRLRDMGGDPFWMLHALEIRPLATVENQLTISRATSIGNGSLPGDGATVDHFLGQGAVPGSLVSVTATAGTFPTGQDQDASFAGVQVRADGQGQFAFRLQRPYATADITSRISVEDVTGAKTGTLTQTYGQPASRLFDMNTGTSPTGHGYVGVTNTTIFAPALGYGWQKAVSSADRGTASSPDNALRDIAYGTDGTFRVMVTPGEVYSVTLRFRDTYAHDKINVYVEGSTTPVSSGLTNLTIPANTNIVQTFSAASNDGILDIRFRDLSTSGDRNWIVNTIELRRSTLPSLIARDAVFAGLAGFRA